MKDIDQVSDSGNLIKEKIKSKNLIYTGVHANFCILDRPYGVRRLLKAGFKCTLLGDLVDIMYNPKKFPYTSHKKALALTLNHIQTYLHCPVINSSDLFDIK